MQFVPGLGGNHVPTVSVWKMAAPKEGMMPGSLWIYKHSSQFFHMYLHVYYTWLVRVSDEIFENDNLPTHWIGLDSITVTL